MMWVCRAGMNSVHFKYYLSSCKIFLPWDGFKTDLNQFETREEYKALVKKEKPDAPRTSVSNWSGQLYTFCKEMKSEDFVLIPQQGSKKYAFAKIISDYMFDETNQQKLWHSREIDIIANDIPREAFSQSLQYSLGAYRTVFKVKAEEEVFKVISSYKK